MRWLSWPTRFRRSGLLLKLARDTRQVFSLPPRTGPCLVRLLADTILLTPCLLCVVGQAHRIVFIMLWRKTMLFDERGHMPIHQVLLKVGILVGVFGLLGLLLLSAPG